MLCGHMLLEISNNNISRIFITIIRVFFLPTMLEAKHAGETECWSNRVDVKFFVFSLLATRQSSCEVEATRLEV